MLRSRSKDKAKAATLPSAAATTASTTTTTTGVTSAATVDDLQQLQQQQQQQRDQLKLKANPVDDRTTRAVFKLQFAKNELHDFSNYVKNWDLKPEAKLSNRAQIMELHIRVKHAEQMWRLYFNQQMDCSGVVDSLDLDSMRRDMIYTRTIFFRSLAKAYVVLGETRVYFDDDFFD
ncbi:uncharacterized protein LOC106655462 [Trichogramma pretiosum]|uniref:uncharacterized protein LOC106655462 n=1 Tax=Trichogramma pretiosum TaxID=7493 RepID=UPI0006C94E42|nr:uncharacterized protein LOC106655462 [Trichogramma pretiosum]